MSKQILAINDNVHDQVQKLLPWFVVGTLRGEEQALVNQHLNVCAECQADFAWQCKLQTMEPTGEEFSDGAPDIDRAFARLRQRIDTGNATSTEKLSWFSSLGWTLRPWMQLALAAQLLLIVALVGFIAVPKNNPASYRALGAGAVGSSNLVVVFSPDTSELDLRRMINAADARIVDGPTVTDAYLLHVPDDKVDTAFHTLRAEHQVTLVEVLARGDGK